ncbi:hypothetical protein MWN33_17185 [Starkeya koreensis]|uniref:Uncharacterized protein n=1 Tax=Ancylobacter koreensis TaxID=266121 RepID=A0ABT0DR59_9HYPH|nr:hypothetical protein [Ancylobacter koreensis]MCK0209771.1 hypothetical protein [Ancylobacter koreensis]
MDFVAPHQLRQANRVGFTVGALVPKPSENNRSVRCTSSGDDPPPGRQEFKSGRQVPLRCDQSRAINDQAVGLHLPGKPFEAVRLGLDLHAPNVAVDDGNIDTGCPMGQTKLFEHQRFGALLGTG